MITTDSPTKELFLEDKGKTLSYPGTMHEDDIKFHADINEYGKSPRQSLLDILSSYNVVDEWKQTAMAVPKLVGAAGTTLIEDVKSVGKFMSNPLGDNPDTPERIQAEKDILESGSRIANSLFETFVGRIYEPVRQFVGGVATGETENLGEDVLSAFLVPSSVKKISSPERTGFTREEAEGNWSALIPRAVAGAIEDVLLYGGAIQNIPKMIENYEVNNVRSLLKSSTEKIHAKTMEVMSMNEKEAWAYMNRPEVSNYLYYVAKKSIKDSKPSLYSGLPVPTNPKAVGKTVGESISALGKKPEVIAKLATDLISNQGGKFTKITEQKDSLYEDEPTIYMDFPTKSGKPATFTIRPSELTPDGIANKIAQNKDVVPAINNVASADQSLIEEAKKYKTAEEFVKKQGKFVYHGTNAKFSEFEKKEGIRSILFSQEKVTSNGFFFSPSKETAKNYGENIIEATINLKKPLIKRGEGVDGIKDKKRAKDLQYILEPMIQSTNYKGDVIGENIDIGIQKYPIDRNDPDWHMIAVGDGLAWDVLDNPESVKRMVERGYDGTIVEERHDDEGFSYFVVDKSQIKTKSQLTSIWEQGQKNTVPPKEPPTKTASGAGDEPTPPYKQRGFVTSIKDELPQLKVSGQYIPRSTDELAQKANTLIKENIEVAEKMAMTGTDDASVATAAELLKHYSDEASKAVSPAVADALYTKAAELGNSIAERLTELGRSVQAASILGRMTPEGQIRFAAKTIQRYNDEVEKNSGLFGIKKKIPELTPEQTKNIIARLKEIAAMPDGELKAMKFKELSNYISDLVPTPLLNKIITIWKAGLLTGLKTSGLNIFSNISHAATETLKDLPATAVDGVVSLFTKKRAVTFTISGLGFGVKEGFEKGWKFLKTGYDSRDVLSKLDYKRVNFGKGRVAKALQAYEETVFKILGAEDQVFYYGAKARSIAEQARVQAINNKLRGEEKKKFVEDLVANPTDDMVVLAVADAETAVFQNQTLLAKVGAKIKEIPGAEFILPFSKTPSAVAMQILNYSPVGAVKTTLQNIGKGKFDQRDFSKGMGRALLGIPILWLGYEMYKNGDINLNKPKSEGEKKLWELEGRKENSIKVGDKWRSISVLGPGGNLLLIGGQFSRAMEKSGSPTEAFSTAVFGSAKSFTEQTFLKGMSSAMDAINDPEKSAEYFTSGLVSSAVPTIIADVAKATDDTERRTENIAEAVAARIPVLRRSLEPQVDVFGQDRMIKENFFEIMADPTRPSTETVNPVVQEIRRLIDEGNKVSTTQVGDREGYKILTQEQNTDLWQTAGRIAYEKISSYMQMDSYESDEDEIKSKNINSLFDKAKTTARAEKVLEITEGLQEDDLMQKLSEAKKDGLLNQEVTKKYNEMR